MEPARAPLVLLDVNETLVDLSPLGERFEEVGAPAHLLPTWFASTLRDGIALAASGAYAGFQDVAREVLATLLAGVSGLRRSPEDAAAHILAGFEELPLHADVEPGLRRMREAGLRVATLTNGSAALTQALLERAGVSDLVERTLDVAAAGRWKPAREPYESACRALGVRPADAALVAAHPWDVHGAKRAGLLGAWLDRQGRRYPDVFAAPDATAGDLPALADELVRLASP